MHVAATTEVKQILAHSGCCLLVALALVLHPAPCRAASGTLKIEVVDEATESPVACRMHLTNAAGKPVKPRRYPSWHDHFVFDGTAHLKLPEGTYRFTIERGPEYAAVTGHFQMVRFGDDVKRVALRRIVHMAEEGWFSGDLHVHRPLDDMELLTAAEDLHVAPAITWWNARNRWAKKRVPKERILQYGSDRFVDLMAGEDERGGGALLFFGLHEPLQIAGADREFPSSLSYLREAKQAGAWVDVEKPFWWDVPAWLASGLVDSVGLANNHLQRDGMLDNEAWGKPRDRQRFPAPWGNGQWSQQIYYHLLNAGFRLPPSAGSASGVLPNPVGYNRMYVFLGEELGYERWWAAFRRGRVVVTNGPLLRPLVAGKFPGHVFQAPASERLALDVNLRLALRSAGGYLEIIKNGDLERSIRLDQWARDGTLDPVEFDRSGWFLIRVVTDNASTFRFASTGPYYVEIGGEPAAVRRRSADFFLNWARERAAMIELDDDQQAAAVDLEHQAAIRFWQARRQTATVD